jgi:hypothetical protein
LYTGLGPVCGTIMRGPGGRWAAGAPGVVAAGLTAIGVCGGGGASGGGGTFVGAAGSASTVAAAAGGGGATGRVAAGGTGFEAAGGAGGGTVNVGRGVVCGTISRGAGAGGAGGFTAAGGDVTGFAGGGAVAAGLVSSGGGTTAGRGGGGAGNAGACCFARIAFSTSPGLEMCERSILVLISSSGRPGREALAADAGAACACKTSRTFTASWSSIELE